jgi:hypothetical protein
LKIEGLALPYPNPFKNREGTTLGYRLNKHAYIEILFYNSRGYEAGKKICEEGDVGGQADYNFVPLTENDFYGELSAGIYFFIIISEDKDVLAKGKLAVIP